MKQEKEKEIELSLIVQEQVLSYKIIWKKRKTFAISVNKNASIVVSAPKKMKQKQIEFIVNENKNKIYSHYKKAMERKKIPAIIQIGKSEVVPFYGKKYKIYIYETNKRECIKEDGEVLEVWIESSKEGYKERIKILLEKWYRKKGKEIFEERGNFYAKKINTSFQRIYIKDQKTCWGSCSNKKNMNFNFRLLMMPCEVLDYCVVHELAHTLEMNHSKAFWLLVSKELPNYKEYRKFLKEETEQFRIE